MMSLTLIVLRQLPQVIEKDSVQFNCPFSIAFEAGSTLERIADAAFATSELSTIQLPSTVRIRDSSCFYCCQMLRSVTLHKFDSSSNSSRGIS
jgi:hypothetical protein